MTAAERLLDIESTFKEKVDRIVPLELDGETLRPILYLKDGTNLRLTEQWSGNKLNRYSFYWLTASGELKTGWDNAPHHTRLKTFPHHKHEGSRENLLPSHETNLDEVMAVVLGEN